MFLEFVLLLNLKKVTFYVYNILNHIMQNISN